MGSAGRPTPCDGMRVPPSVHPLACNVKRIGLSIEMWARGRRPWSAYGIRQRCAPVVCTSRVWLGSARPSPARGPGWTDRAIFFGEPGRAGLRFFIGEPSRAELNLTHLGKNVSAKAKKAKKFWRAEPSRVTIFSWRAEPSRVKKVLLASRAEPDRDFLLASRAGLIKFRLVHTTNAHPPPRPPLAH